METTKTEQIEQLKKREWVYVGSPSMYDIAPCSCGNTETQWSEYSKHLWCSKCEKDFVPEHDGVFGGPILANIAGLLGICFDRVNITTGKVVKFNIDETNEEWDKAWP